MTTKTAQKIAKLIGRLNTHALIILLALKIAGVISWGWGWVLFPLWSAPLEGIILTLVLITFYDKDKYIAEKFFEKN